MWVGRSSSRVSLLPGNGAGSSPRPCIFICSRSSKVVTHSASMNELGETTDEQSVGGFLGAIGVSFSACNQHLNGINRGMALHCLIFKRGLQEQQLIARKVILMYSKCGRVDFARQFLDERATRDAVIWNSMISGYLINGKPKDAIDLFSSVAGGNFVNNFTLSNILKACVLARSIQGGRAVHGIVFKLNFSWDIVLAGSLMDMYLKLGFLGRARTIFEMLRNRDLVSWNTILSGLVQFSLPDEAVRLFQRMKFERFFPNEVTFVCVLKASSLMEDYNLGRSFHSLITKCGFFCDTFVGTALVDMYSRCLEIEDSEMVFLAMKSKNVVSFNAIIGGYVLVGSPEKGMQAYVELLKKAMRPDFVTITSLLSSISSACLPEGLQIHCHAIKLGLDSYVSLGNALVGFYAKCGLTDEAVDAFSSVIKPNSVSWAGIISSLVKRDEGEKALSCFKTMLSSLEKPDEFSVSAVLKTSADWAAAEQGKHLQSLAIRLGLESAVYVATSLVDMYCKCGMVEDALKVFHNMPLKNEVTWNAMIIGLGNHGKAGRALELLHEMVDMGLQPDGFTFVGVLVACCNAGLVDEGRSYFNLMRCGYGIRPSLEHYTAVISLLVRAGLLHEAEVLTKACPFLPDLVMQRIVGRGGGDEEFNARDGRQEGAWVQLD
ncbi:pentatricopeptide repeat-containing protein At5g27110-like isoform X2 [Wolffia australiana]